MERFLIRSNPVGTKWNSTLRPWHPCLSSGAEKKTTRNVTKQAAAVMVRYRMGMIFQDRRASACTCLSSHCDQLQSLGTFCHIMMRSPRFIPTYHDFIPSRGCRGKFFASLKIWPDHRVNDVCHGQSPHISSRQNRQSRSRATA